MPLIKRHPMNPIVDLAMIPEDPRFDVLGVFNPAATRYKDQTLLLLRVAKFPKHQPADEVWAPIYNLETGNIDMHKVKRAHIDDSDPRVFKEEGKLYLTSISEFYLARIGADGTAVVDPEPFMKPADCYEIYGIEDPRITLIDGVYYITYTACSDHGLAVRIARTSDWETVERLDIALPPCNKDCVLFPEQIQGRYHMYHRPSTDGVPKPEMWHATSPDMLSWGSHHWVMSAAEGWEADRIGAGAPPIKTEDGWLMFFHGADEEANYSLGALLLDLEDPRRILWRSQNALMKPEAPYELEGFFSGVVFVTGAVQIEDRIDLYYGASDTLTCVASVRLDDILSLARKERAGQTEGE